MSNRWLLVLGLVLATDACFAQAPSDNPYRPVRGLADGGGRSIPGGEWARLPGGREMGPPASVHVDADGEVGSSRVDLQACKLEYSIVSPK